MRKKDIQICKCSKCGYKFEMPINFMGRILCENCDPFMTNQNKKEIEKPSGIAWFVVYLQSVWLITKLFLERKYFTIKEK